MKTFEVTYSFKEVRRFVKAEDEETAEEEAQRLLETDETIQWDAECDVVIVNEVVEG